MSTRDIILILLVILFLGGLRDWGPGPGYGFGYRGLGGIGFLLVVLLVLWLLKVI